MTMNSTHVDHPATPTRLKMVADMVGRANNAQIEIHRCQYKRKSAWFFRVLQSNADQIAQWLRSDQDYCGAEMTEPNWCFVEFAE